MSRASDTFPDQSGARMTGRRRPWRLVTGGAMWMIAMAGHAVAPPNPEDLTQGVWELDAAKSDFCKPVPQKSRREITDVGWGLISVYWTGMDADGNEMSTRYVYRYDGDEYPATIVEPADESITWKLVDPRRVEFTHWSKDGKITEELVRTVSADGQEMTQTRAYVDADDPEGCVDIQVFRRQ